MSGRSRPLVALASVLGFVGWLAGLRRRLVASLRRLPDHTRVVLRIARWEVSHTAGTVDRRTLAVGVAALLLAGGAAGLAATGQASTPNAGIYPVAVDDDSPFHEPVADATALRPVPADSDRAVVFVRDADTSDVRATFAIDRRAGGKATAALSTLRDVVRRHNTRLMDAEPNRSAAFPVNVTLSYVVRDDGLPASVRDTGAGAGGGGTGGDGTGSGGGDSDDAGTGDSGTGGGDGTGGTGTSAGSGASDGSGTGAPGRDDGGPLSVPSVGGGGLFGGQSTGSPAEISPPFPFSSLLLAFLFLVPMNFVIQAFGSSVLDERVNRRGELLLVAPISRLDIVAGKTLPYLAASLAAIAAIALAVGGGPITVAAVAPVALVFLGATFLGAMFARSFKELTFVTVTVSVFLTTYVFVPAIFTTITPVALISPLTLVVRDLQPSGAATTLFEYVFSTGPFYLVAGVLFLLGTGVYREEDMFTQRSIPKKFLDALDARLTGVASVGLLTALFLPFVFVAELLGVALFVAVPRSLALPAILVIVAVVEELAKSVHVYAGFEKARFERRLPVAVTLGVVSGVGFFVAEKFTAIVQFVGLDRLPAGEAAFATGGIGVAGALGLLAAPLVLHVVTGAVAAVGASRGRTGFGVGLGLAMAIHFAYDYLVVVIFLG
ncbi:PrsW family intramembrane metalloprotease [Halobaculum sp. MBLA0147]|uniref:PrsW family intramembrane metalloprotease n=1 Tax=Halobaculum sp. MBLA0147 TaxID=3079934 RepID=UPI003526AA28